MDRRKLTWDQVQEARAKHAADPVRFKSTALAFEYGVAQSTMWNALTWLTYKRDMPPKPERPSCEGLAAYYRWYRAQNRERIERNRREWRARQRRAAHQAVAP